MKFVIEQSLDCKETEIKITCGMIDQRLKRLIEQIQLFSFSVMGERDGVTTPIALEEICYFESVDNKTFLYTGDQVYRCDPKLYELEHQLAQTTFVRVSKRTILNTLKVTSVSAQFSGRLEAVLGNGETIVISKSYAKAFKEKFE